MDLGIPGYEWQETIGRGGFGIVHRARDITHGRDVAIKVLVGDFSDSALRRFDRERRAMGAVSTHPNIAALYTSGFTHGGHPYLVMPLLTGGSYADRLEQGPLPTNEVIDVGIAIADAVHVAHEAAILHCDIKPANILRSSFGAPVLTDFGIANLLDDTAIASGIAASPAYAAPEVLRGEAATTRSDVYSLGATLFSLVQGAVPFARDTDQSPFVVINRVLNDPSPVLTRPDVPDALRGAIAAAMDKDPDGRPSSMAALRDALRSAITAGVVADAPGAETVAGLNLLAPPPSGDAAAEVDAPEPLLVAASAPPRRRGRVLAGVAVAAAAVVVVGLVAAASGDDDTRTATSAPSTSASPEAASTVAPTSAPTTVASTSTTAAPPTTEPTPAPTLAAPVAVTVAPPSPTQAAAPSPPPSVAEPTNTPPTLALTPRTSDEQQSVNVTLAAADPDGDPVILTVSGLPSGLTLNGTTVVGTISHDAANVTTDRRQGIASATFEVTVIATDGRGGSATSSFTWTVRDTHRLMPNYIDRPGDGSDGLPNVAALSAQQFSCAFDPTGDDSRVFRQSVAPGTVIAWGQTVLYWYGRNDNTCQTVAKGW